MIGVSIILAIVLIAFADLWLVWMSPGVSLSAAVNPAMLGPILSYVWPALLAGAVLALGVALPFQLRVARRVVKASLNRAARQKAREFGREEAYRALEQREQAAEIREQRQADQDAVLQRQEAEIKQHIQAGIEASQQETRAAQAAQQTAEAERDAALTAQKHAEGMAQAAEKRRQNAVAAARRRRNQAERLKAKIALLNPCPANEA